MTDLINKWDVVSKLIDLENEFQHYKPFHGFEHAMYRKICELEMEIGKSNTVDAVEVAHASWIEDGYYGNPFVCSHCGSEGCYYGDCHNKKYYYTNYCPNCGARMDGDGNG